MALNAIIIIYWTRKGQRLTWNNSLRQTHSHQGGREIIILLVRVHQQGAFHRAGEANSRNVQQWRKKKRESAAVKSSYRIWIGGKYSQATSAWKCLLKPLPALCQTAERRWKLKSPPISSSCMRVPKPLKHHLSVQAISRPIQQVFKVDPADKRVLGSSVSVLSVTSLHRENQNERRIRSSNTSSLAFSASQWEQH